MLPYRDGMALTWDDLAGRARARQLPATEPDGVVGMLQSIGPIQAQTARSPFLALAARFPGVTHDELTTAYESFEVVRGSTLRGTVHTCTAQQHPALDAGTRVGQRRLWTRMLRLDDGRLDELWAGIEEFARDEWRTPDELSAYVAEVVGTEPPTRYLAFGHGGLVRRPVHGSWSGQSAPAYRTASSLIPAEPATLDDLVRLHLRCHGPASRHDIAWWSGLGLRVVDEVLDRLDLPGEEGPDGRRYVDVPGAPPPRTLDDVRFLPEFDALMCGYEPSARVRFSAAGHLRRLWNQSNGMVLPPLLVDGRITGYWRAPGSAPRRALEVVWFAGTRKPRKAELDAPVAALEAALAVSITSVTVTREVA